LVEVEEELPALKDPPLSRTWVLGAKEELGFLTLEEALVEDG
jgi:hypothetical protein